MPFLAHLCTPCDIISMKTMPPNGREHLQLYCAKFEVNPTDSSRVIYNFVHPHSCSCSNTLPICLPLTICLLHQIHHPWPTRCPDPVPLPTYNWAASDQMQEFCLFKCQLETWTWIRKIKAEENLIIYSASWAKRAMPPWIDGYQQMKLTRMTPWSS